MISTLPTPSAECVKSVLDWPKVTLIESVVKYPVIEEDTVELPIESY